MNKQEQYREEFEEEYCNNANLYPYEILKEYGVFRRLPNGEYTLPDVNNCWFGYLAGRKKGDEYIERLEKELSLYDDDVRDFNKQIQELKEQLKREAECVDYVAENSSHWREIEKRARSIQAQRKVL